jgi:hypothetical protein
MLLLELLTNFKSTSSKVDGIAMLLAFAFHYLISNKLQSTLVSASSSSTVNSPTTGLFEFTCSVFLYEISGGGTRLWDP